MADTKGGPRFFLDSLESTLVAEGAIVEPHEVTLERARDACQLLEAEVDALRKELAARDAHLDGRLDAMLNIRPKLWGSPEAYELQVLLLLELRFAGVLHPHAQNTRAINERYSTFLRRSFTEAGCRPLSSITDDFILIAQTLSAFRRSLAAEASKVR
jgi:hypothetical protein